MPGKSEQDKLRALLAHWIEHNAEHAAEFRRWTGIAGEAANEIEAAAGLMESANEALSDALIRLGGPIGHDHSHQR